MAKIDLYHGSERIISRPWLGGGNPHNDYGSGFYCTRQLALAYEWACTDSYTGFANKYELDMSGLKVLNLNGKEYNILNWLAILLENRIFDLNADLPETGRRYMLSCFLPSYKDCDVIVGYRADDSYFSFARAFLNNSISLGQLSRAMHLGKLGEQTVLRSEKAFNALTALGGALAERDIYYPRRMARDREAREAFRSMQTEDNMLDAVYLIDIMRQNWRNDDVRLR